MRKRLALWGHERLHKVPLNWKSIKILQTLSADSTKTGQQQLERILSQASEVFKEATGTLNHTKTKIILDEKA